jgi:hypothetical protein
MNCSIKNVDTFLLDQFDQTYWRRGGVWFFWKTSSCRELQCLSVWRLLILVIASLGGLDNVGLCLSHYSRYVHMGNWLQTLKMCPHFIFRLAQSCLMTAEIQHFQNPIIFFGRYTSLGLTRHFLLRAVLVRTLSSGQRTVFRQIFRHCFLVGRAWLSCK